jgi:hypothetical protein
VLVSVSLLCNLQVFRKIPSHPPTPTWTREWYLLTAQRIMQIVHLICTENKPLGRLCKMFKVTILSGVPSHSVSRWVPVPLLYTEEGVSDEPYSAKPSQRSGLYRHARLRRIDTVPAYVDWRGCTATPLSGVS